MNPAVAAAIALAEASAAVGTTAGRLGYTLTTKALEQSTAAAVFPLLVLEATAIAEGLAAYIAVDAAAKVANAAAAAEMRAAALWWR